MNFNMTQCKFYFIGIQFLFLSHVARSFVLLTANMEDVKKIARKFVSDSLADKIAEFVVKATEQMISNVSQENKNNEDNIEMTLNQSNEDYKRKIAREGAKKATRTTRESDSNKENEQSKISFQEQYDTSTARKDWTPKDTTETVRIYWEKELNEMPQSKKEHAQYEQPKSDMESVRTTRKLKNPLVIENKMSHMKESRVPSMSFEQHIGSKNTKNTRHLSTFRPTIDSTHLYASEALPNDKPKLSPRYQRPVKRGYRLTGIDSKEPSSDIRNNLYMSVPTTVRGFNINRPHMTTGREKNEFDQYDNPKYPKAEYIATSGPVALPKVQMQKPWWEKELPVQENW